VPSWPALRARVAAQAAVGSPMTLDLLRHGESTYNAEGRFTGTADVALTGRGRSQAAAAGPQLAADYALACSSPLARSRETLELALAASEARVEARVVDARLAERSMGALEGRPLTPLPAHGAGELDWAPPGGDSYVELTRRVLALLLDVRAAVEPGGRVLLCSHLGPLRLVVAMAHGTRDPAAVMTADAPNARVLTVELGPLSWPLFLPGSLP
jgi:broad specificity phosphatase PhoE